MNEFEKLSRRYFSLRNQIVETTKYLKGKDGYDSFLQEFAHATGEPIGKDPVDTILKGMSSDLVFKKAVRDFTLKTGENPSAIQFCTLMEHIFEKRQLERRLRELQKNVDVAKELASLTKEDYARIEIEEAVDAEAKENNEGSKKKPSKADVLLFIDYLKTCKELKEDGKKIVDYRVSRPLD
jgi:hypothetical protein